MTGDTERYPGEWENAAKLTRLARERRLAAGWHHRGWKDPASLLRSLDDCYSDPSELRQLAYDRQRERAAADPVYADDADRESLEWLSRHTCINRGPS